jgi:hypothetical protein
MSPTLRGIFLTSDAPAETARFYREVAALELEQVGAAPGYVYWKVDHNQFQLAIHDAKLFAHYAHPVVPHSNLTHLYFKIENQSEFLDHLESQRIEAFAIDEVVVTLTDPDGRRVMFGLA